MLSFCEKVFDGPVDAIGTQYTPESTWMMVGKADQLYIQARCGQTTVASVVVTVAIELSNDGQSFAAKAGGSFTVTLTTAGTIVYGQLADGGTSPNGCYVRLKVTATVGAAYCTVWVAGRTQ